MPGLGKTQLALRYAKLVFDRKEFPIVIWISAATTEKLNQGYNNVLNLVGHVDRNHPEPSARLTAARRWLEGYHASNSSAWLLIFDNANRDTLSFLRENLPRSSYGGCILFTTRTDDTAKALASSAGKEHHTLGLQAPGIEDAARLFLDNVGMNAATMDSDVMLGAKELVKSVGRLPLAVDQAASFMKQNHQTIDHVLELYRSDQKKIEVSSDLMSPSTFRQPADALQAISWENDLSTYEQASVAAAFSIQFKELSRLSPDTNNLMRILSFLDPESIATDIITNGVEELRRASAPHPGKRLGLRDKLKKTMGGRRRIEKSRDKLPSQLPPRLDSLIALLQSPIRFQEAIQQLRSLSLVQQQTHATTSALRIHDLVQFLAQENTRIEGSQQQWSQCAVTLVCGAIQQVESPRLPTCWSQWEMFVPHIQSLTKYAHLHSDENLLLLDANIDVVDYWRARGRYREAESLCQETLAGYVKQLGPRHLNTLKARRLLANIYESQGLYKKAEILHKQVLLEMKQSLGLMHPATLDTMNELAYVYSTLGSYEEAKTLYSQVLKENQRIFESGHLHTLVTLQNLANKYRDQGQDIEAEKAFNQVLSSQRRQLGSEHPATLKTMSYLAHVYSDQGQHSRAEALYQQALEGQERQLGSEHPATLRTIVTPLARQYL